MKLSEYFADPSIIEERIGVARKRALRAISRLGEPSRPQGVNDTVYVGLRPSLRPCANDRWYQALQCPFDQLVYMLDDYDGHRARMRMRQNGVPYVGTLVQAPTRINPPSDVKKRRAAIFSAKDMPDMLIADLSRHQVFTMVEWVRFELMRLALRNMERDGELFLLNEDVWQVYVTVMDDYRRDAPKSQKRRKKHDDRHFHGHPRSHRQRVVTSI